MTQFRHSRGGHIIIVGGEKFVAEKQSDLYGFEAVEGWHSYWSAGDLFLSASCISPAPLALAVYLTVRIEQSCILYTYFTSSEKTSGYKPNGIACPPLCVAIFKLFVSENLIDMASYPRRLESTPVSLWMLRTGTNVPRFVLNFVCS